MRGKLSKSQEQGATISSKQLSQLVKLAAEARVEAPKGAQDAGTKGAGEGVEMEMDRFSFFSFL
jgi:hypothetical protein